MNKGIAILPLVLIISAILAIIGITIATSSFLETQSGQAVEQTAMAEAAAWAGLNDALRRVANDRAFASAASGSCTGSEYELTLASNTKACVGVTTEADVDGGDAGTVICDDIAVEGRNTIIVVRGIASSRERRIRAEGASAADWVKCNGDLDEANLSITEPTS